MRLTTKILLFSALIFTVLMLAVAILTQGYLEQVFDNQTERALDITWQGFEQVLQNLHEDQTAKATMQAQRNVLCLATYQHFNPILNWWLRQAQADLNVNRLEIIDAEGFLLADGDAYYDQPERVLPSPAATIGSNCSYLARRGGELYIISAVPLDYLDQRVGYLGVGKRLNQAYIGRLSTMIHGQVVIMIGSSYAVGSLGATPPNLLQPPPGLKLGTKPFRTSLKTDRAEYDFYFSALESGGLLQAAAGVGLDRSDMLATKKSLRLFLLILALAGLVFSWSGAYLVARNIKRSIFGMEPAEIAAVLNERNAIIQSTFEGIIAIDRKGTITLVNKGAQKLLPAGVEGLGRKIGDLLPDPEIARVLGEGTDLFNQQHVMGETIVFYNAVPIKVHSEVVGAVITLRDLTEFQKVAAELVELKSFTQALRAQSHEFSNKLHTISGLIQLHRYDEALQQLHDTAQNHQEMITFLMRAIPSSTVSGLLLGKFNRANELNVRFNLSRSSRLMPSSSLSENELVCIIGNLIENALESLRTLDREDKQIWVKIVQRPGHLSILVADNGTGIPRAIRNKIFARGYTTKSGRNKGLGLALVMQCVRNLRGTIRLHSDRLTVFLVRIPIARDGETSGVDRSADRGRQSSSA